MMAKVKTKKPKITIRYRKVTNPNLPVAEYHPTGHVDEEGREHISSVVIRVDPIVKKKRNARLKKVILKHELDEIAARVKGHSRKESHKIAEAKEPHWVDEKYRTDKQLQDALRRNG